MKEAKKEAREDTKPFVSIIIPCRNEEPFIGKCLDSVIGNDYSKERMEVIVIDGLSDDGTRKVLEDYGKRYPYIRNLDNPKREQQIALNIGITSARGEIILRMDAHSTYKYNYISECVKALQEYPADNVGGRWIIVPRTETRVGTAIAHAVSVPFGVGDAYYRLTKLSSKSPVLTTPKWGINVAYFCCRKEVFDKIGLFNENLDRSEDIDFRSRLKKAGYRTLFVPSIECYYAMRTGFSEFVKHMFKNGKWVLLPLNHAPNISFSFRHIVPLLFVCSLLLLGFLSFFHPLFFAALILELAVYFAANLYFSLGIALRERTPSYFFILPFVFFTLHFSYGWGSVVGLANILKFKLSSLFRPKKA